VTQVHKAKDWKRHLGEGEPCVKYKPWIENSPIIPSNSRSTQYYKDQAFLFNKVKKHTILQFSYYSIKFKKHTILQIIS